MKKALLTLVAIAAIGGSVYAYYRFRDTGPKFTVTTAQVGRGDVVESVGATGTLQAVTTVQVGTQVSGTIESLYADFNSLVKKGQVLARLDPSLFQTQIEQARANLIRAQADLARLKVSLEDAQKKLARARELSQRQLIPKSDLETAEVTVQSAEAQIQSQNAQITQAQASLSQNEVNLQHTVIEAPIDGLVISRSVDVGQTVAASMQAPTLFILAADLTKMQVVANLDESDVGRIRPGQHVSFRVDAYPTESFTGSVSQVRLEPKVQQNVVTYATVIDVPNQQLKLKPGMTANVNIEIAKATDVLRVPNAALRFRPTTEMYTAIGQTPPEPGGRGRGGAPGAPGAPSPVPGTANPSTSTTPAAPAPAVTAQTTPAAPAASQEARPRRERGAGSTDGQAVLNSAEGGEESGGRRGGGMNARMQNMSPEEREQFLARMRARGFDPTAQGGAAGGPGGGRGGRGTNGTNGNSAANAPARGRGAAPPATGNERQGGATTIDALFGPLPRTESVGRVYTYSGGQLHPVRVRLGIADGQATELIEGELQQGEELVTNIAIGDSTRPAATSAFPGLGQPQRGGFPGGNPGGGNRGGGGNGGGNRGGGR